MSFEALRWAWDVPVKTSSQRLVLLSLANYAGDKYTAFPSMETLAAKTSLNLKTVKKVVRELIELGLVEDTKEKRGTTHKVRVLKLKGIQSWKQTQNWDDLNSTDIGSINEGNKPKIGSIKQSQKRVGSTEQMNPILDSNEPNIGTLNEPNIGSQNLSIEPIKETIVLEKEKSESFNFAKALKEIGADTKLIEDWMKVRKTKKATNTLSAFKGFQRELSKSKLDVNTALQICAERSWSGFNASYLQNIDLSTYRVADTLPSAPIHSLPTDMGDW